MTQHEIVTRAEAKARGLTRYFTGKPCPHGHLAERMTSTGACRVCLRASKLRWEADNADAHRVSASRRNQRYNAKNRDKQADALKAWRKASPEISRAHVTRRRAQRAQATPAWELELTKLVEREAAHLAVMRERATGIAWHVDHMIPLRARRVSGLHVWNNLQVIPGVLNVEKCNRLMLTHPGEWVRHV